MSMLVNPFWQANEPFDPNDFGATMWISGDDPLLAGLSTGDPIGGTTPWTDRISGTRVWVQGAVNNRPVWRPSGAGGANLPYVEFDGTNDFLDFDTNNSSVILDVDGYYMVFVARVHTNGATAATEENGLNVFTSNGYVGLRLDNGNKFRNYRFNGSYTGINSTTTFALNTWYIIELRYDNTNLYIRVNKDTELSVAATQPQQLSDVPRICGNAVFQLDLAEAIAIDANPTLGDRDTIVDDLAAKYIITVP